MYENALLADALSLIHSIRLHACSQAVDLAELLVKALTNKNKTRSRLISLFSSNINELISRQREAPHGP